MSKVIENRRKYSKSGIHYPIISMSEEIKSNIQTVELIQDFIF